MVSACVSLRVDVYLTLRSASGRTIIGHNLKRVGFEGKSRVVVCFFMLFNLLFEDRIIG